MTSLCCSLLLTKRMPSGMYFSVLKKVSQCSLLKEYFEKNKQSY